MRGIWPIHGAVRGGPPWLAAILVMTWAAAFVPSGASSGRTFAAAGTGRAAGAGPPRPHPPAPSRAGNRPVVPRRHRLLHHRDLPISFEPNQGQADPRAGFVARSQSGTVLLAANEAMLCLSAQGGPEPPLARGEQSTKHGHGATQRVAMVRMRLVGADPRAPAQAANRLPGRVSYFRGGDRQRWRTGIPTYARVWYRDVYPGVDLCYYGSQGRLEHDLVVAPGTDPSVVRLTFDGQDAPHLDSRGNLVLRTGAGVLRQTRPVAYQEVGGTRHLVRGGYTISRGRQVGFRVGRYDHSRPLILDPVLDLASYVGGSDNDYGADVASDAQGNIYVAGTTNSVDLPVQDSFGMKPHVYYGYQKDAFVTKLDPSGSRVLYSAYLGGSQNDYAAAIEVDPAGSAYVVGGTLSYEQAPVDIPDAGVYLPGSDGFPVTPGGYETQSHSDGLFEDAFLTKISPDGSSLLYSTYLGQQGRDLADGLALDGAGHAWVVGLTWSYETPLVSWYRNFPTTPGALRTTYAGGASDGFVTELDTTQMGDASLLYSTYLGGTGADEVIGVATDAQGSVYVTGITSSQDFPITPGAYQTTNYGGGAGVEGDVFVTKLKPGPGGLVYSTFLGGGNGDKPCSIAVDASGSAIVTGITYSSVLDRPFPTTPGSLQPQKGDEAATWACALAWNSIETTIEPSGAIVETVFPHYGPFICQDTFLTKLNPKGTALVYSTYFGGDLSESAVRVALDPAGNAWVAGNTGSRSLAGVDTVPTLIGGSSGDLSTSAVGWLAEFGRGGGLLFLGRTGPLLNGMALGPGGSILLVGSTGKDLPVTAAAAQRAFGGAAYDAFVLKLTDLLPPPPGATKGDVTGDGKIDIRDVVLLLKVVAGLSPEAPETVASGDLTADGRLDTRDLVALLRLVANL